MAEYARVAVFFGVVCKFEIFRDDDVVGALRATPIRLGVRQMAIRRNPRRGRALYATPLRGIPQMVIRTPPPASLMSLASLPLLRQIPVLQISGFFWALKSLWVLN